MDSSSSKTNINSEGSNISLDFRSHKMISVDSNCCSCIHCDVCGKRKQTEQFIINIHQMFKGADIPMEIRLMCKNYLKNGGL